MKTSVYISFIRKARAASGSLTKCALWTLLCGLTLVGQTTTAIDGSTPPAIAGGQPAGSYPLSGFDTVNLYSGNLNFRVPLVSLQGRGSSGAKVILPIERHWIMAGAGNGSYLAEDASLAYPTLYTQPYTPGTLTVREVGTDLFTNCTDGVSAMYQTTLTRFTFTEADGTQHDFVDALTGGSSFSTSPVDVSTSFQTAYSCPAKASTSRGVVWVSRDDTFSTLILDSDVTDGTAGAPSPIFSTGSRAARLYAKDGTLYQFNSQGYLASVRDRNGNTVTYTYDTNTNDTNSYGKIIGITDSLGRQITITYAPFITSTGSIDPYDTITYPGSNGNQRTIKVHYCDLDPTAAGITCPNYTGTASQTYYQLFGYSSPNTPYNPTVVSYVELPDSRQYQFTYNAYGEPTKVKLPTGGSFQYSYGAGDGSSGPGVIGGTGGPGPQIYRRVQQRSAWLSDSVMQGTTTYQPTYNSSCTPSVPASGVTECTMVGETEKDASGAVLSATRHWFYGNPTDTTAYHEDGEWYSQWAEGREYQTEMLNTAGSFNVMNSAALKTETNTYEQRTCISGEICPAPYGNITNASPVDVRVKETDTALQDVSPSLVSKNVYSYDQFNNVTEVDQYGYYGLYRKNLTSYFSSRSIGGVSWDYWNIPTVNGKYGTYSGGAIVHIRNLPSLQQTTDANKNVVAQTTFDYDNYDQHPLTTEGGLTQWDSSVPAARGNVTTKSALLLQQQSRSLSTVYNYDNAGSVVSVTDPKNNTTTVAYSNAYANAFPTLITFPLGNQYNVQTAYDFNTGKPTSFTDMNGNVTSYKYADELERLTEADLPDGGVTTFGYCDAGSNQSCPSGSPANSVTKTVKQNSCSSVNSIVTDALYDGLGRTTKTHQYENPGAIVVQTLFDGMGRTSSVSNPMRSENPTDVNITAYDSLGRVKSVTAPDGSVTSTTRLGATLTSVDPAGVSKNLTYDAFGRLTQVLENPGSGQYSTNYLYDVLDDLTVVCQGSFDAYGNCQSGGLGRSFSYDSLKRLMYAMNPESGTISYSYDDNGNVLTKTDARGWVTCYGAYSGSSCANGYDPINRPTAKTYYNAAAPANTIAAPSVAWVWDTISKGRLSSVSAASASPSYTSSTQFQAYDTMGRVTQSTQTTNGNNYTFYYAYNLAGTVESETYPSARAVKTCYDSAGRSLSVAGTPSSGQTTTYASNVTYAPHGAIQQLSRGDSLTEIRSYNNRLQENAISLGTSGNARSAFGQDMYYCANGAATCTTNNGNLLSLNLPYLSAQQSFSYDPINRLITAAETSPGTAWSQSYGYDAFGNRWVSGGITTSPFTPIAASNFDTNNRLQIQGSVYDASGDMTAIGGYTYQNDSEGHIATVAINGSSTLYGYDGDNHRILKQASAGTTIYVYDASGDLSAEYSTATQMNPCLTCYLTADYLGSTRLITSSAGATVSQHDYLPFGEEVPLAYGGRTALPGFQAASTDDVNQKFTGKERDNESGLDFSQARYFGSALGRFTSPDPANLSVDFWIPQTWNRYAYALNNPLSMVDRNGLWPTWIHNIIVQDSFPGLSNGDIQTLQKASHDTDYVNRVNGLDPQDPAASFVHGMSNGLANQSPSEAQAEGDSFIADNEAKAQQLQADWMASGHEGISPAALTAFGNALHTVMDRTSPSHRGNQPWYGMNGRQNQARAARHFFGEVNMSNADRNAAVAAARAAFQQTFGSYFSQMSINQPLMACVTTYDSASKTTTKTCN